MERDLRSVITGVQQKLDELRKRHRTEDDLFRITEAVGEKAENQRKDFGPAYGVANSLREASKDFIRSLERGDIEAVLEDFRGVFGDLWWVLGQLDLTPHFASRQDAESGGELGEAEAVYDLHRLLYNREIQGKDALIAETRRILERLWYKLGDPTADPLLAELVDKEEQAAEEARKTGQAPPKRVHQITLAYPAWLAGIGDAPGELSKFVTRANAAAALEEGPELRYADQKDLLVRFLHIARTVHDFLSEFETCYPQVINNSQRPGWFNTYRGMLGRIAGLVRHWHETLGELCVKDAQHQALLEEMKAILNTRNADPQIKT